MFLSGACHWGLEWTVTSVAPGVLASVAEHEADAQTA